jgi:regulator of protease activity HflC (stomatin/prohibitin superfamily)
MRNNNVGLAVFVVFVAAGAAGTALIMKPAPLIAGLALGLYLLFAIRVADQWEKVAVLRFGRYIGLRGPGMFTIIPIVDTVSRYVDQRVRVASVSAESTLTRDTVPVNVDAIVFWMVWNPEKSILEVQDYTQAITLSAQTALRESIGRH